MLLLVFCCFNSSLPRQKFADMQNIVLAVWFLTVTLQNAQFIERLMRGCKHYMYCKLKCTYQFQSQPDCNPTSTGKHNINSTYRSMSASLHRSLGLLSRVTRLDQSDTGLLALARLFKRMLNCKFLYSNWSTFPIMQRITYYSETFHRYLWATWVALQYFIHLEGLSGHAVTLPDHAERRWDLHEVDLTLFVPVPGKYKCFYYKFKCCNI